MKWVEIKVYTAREAVEAVSAILLDLGTEGVMIEDPKDLENVPMGMYGELLDKNKFTSKNGTGVKVIAYLPETLYSLECLSKLKEEIAKLTAFDLDIGENKVVTSKLDEEEWAASWKKYYHPVRVTRFLTVVPSWENYNSANDELILRLDPGMAFGTGTHPTTRLSLQALESVMHGGETVLDVGTGSGVLSIASKVLGADKVYAYDLDPVAIDSAKKNLSLNEAAKDVKVLQTDLLKTVKQEAEVIVANILAEIIVLLVEDAYRLLKPGGYFIISGIIEEKQEMILAAVFAVDFILEQTLQQGDWLTFILKKSEG